MLNERKENTSVASTHPHHIYILTHDEFERYTNGIGCKKDAIFKCVKRSITILWHTNFNFYYTCSMYQRKKQQQRLSKAKYVPIN